MIEEMRTSLEFDASQGDRNNELYLVLVFRIELAIVYLSTQSKVQILRLYIRPEDGQPILG
jgi:hypothetical protein